MAIRTLFSPSLRWTDYAGLQGHVQMGSICETFPRHTHNMPTDILATLTGRTIHDLSVPLEAGMPVHPSHPPFSLALQRRHGDTSRTGGMSSANELIVMCGHSGTHLDALGHFFVERFFDGFPEQDFAHFHSSLDL